MSRPRRMWVNQPSKYQPWHMYNGMRVLAVYEYGETYTVYFLSGATVSAQALGHWLSEGWP